MYASYLSENILTHDRFVGGNGDTRVGLHETAHIVETLLVDGGVGSEVVTQDSLHTGQRSITRTFTQAVDSSVQALGSSRNSSIHIAHGKVVVIVGMEVEVRVRIALHHHTHKLLHLHGVEDTQGIRQHEATDTTALKPIHELEHIVGRVLHTVAPVLEIHIYRHTLLCGIGHGATNVCDMFFGSAFQLLGTMFE